MSQCQYEGATREIEDGGSEVGWCFQVQGRSPVTTDVHIKMRVANLLLQQKEEN